jgi:hypothetical protein
MAGFYRATARVATLTGGTKDPETYGSGPNTTEALAIAELQAILAAVVGVTVISATVSHQLDLTAAGLALKNSTDQYEDAVIVLQKVVSGNLVEKTLTVENMSNTVLLNPGISPVIDDSNALVGAIANAYHDGQAVGGYALAPGKSYMKN